MNPSPRTIGISALLAAVISCSPSDSFSEASLSEDPPVTTTTTTTTTIPAYSSTSTTTSSTTSSSTTTTLPRFCTEQATGANCKYRVTYGMIQNAADRDRYDTERSGRVAQGRAWEHSCLQAKLDRAIELCTRGSHSGYQMLFDGFYWGNAPTYGDTGGYELEGYGTRYWNFHQYGDREEVRANLNTDDDSVNLRKLSEGDDCVGNEFFRDRLQTTVYDSDCNVVTDDVQECDICEEASLVVAVSPISLVWNEEESHATASIVKFPLDPSAANRYYLWRASTSLPLLVYDPTHEGRITSGEQLFGNHTFGKRWSHGFEALGSLDANQDGELSGEELKPLALWFDNQNGTAEVGEVRSLSEAGVVKLFYQGATKSTQGDDYTLSLGFEHRAPSGEMRKGAAIDWFGPSFSSIEEARAYYEKLSAASPPTTQKEAQNEARFDIAPFTGAWVWELESPQGRYSPTGILFLKEKNGKIVGTSVSEILIKNAEDGGRSIVRTDPVSGEFMADSNGKTRLSLHIAGLHGRSTVTSVLLSADARAMSGESRIAITSAGDRKEATTFVYRWKAKRLRATL